MGLIASDGYINNNNNIVALRLSGTDSFKLLQTLIYYFEFNGKLFKYRNSYEFRINSKKLITILNSIGIPSKNKTFLLQFPINFPDIECTKMYFRGIHDGDGNIKRKRSKKSDKWLGGEWRLLTASHSFIYGVCNKFNSIFNTDYKLRINSRKGDKEYPEMLTNQKDGRQFIKWVYEGFPEYRLENKYLMAMSIFKDDIV
jgi:hypothetical protein